MKVIVSSQALTPWYGGSAISEASLYAELAKQNEVTILCRKGALDYSFARSFGIKEVVEISPEDVFDAWRNDSHWLGKLFDGKDVFHLNGHWKWENFFLAKLCVRKEIPYVLHPRGMLLVGHRRVMLKKVFNLAIGNWVVRHAARVIALSRYELNQFSPYSIPAERTVVLPNGISMPNLIVPSTDAGRSPYFLYIGRLERRKNLLFLIEVFAQYLKNGGTAQLHLVGPSERDYDKEIESRARALNLGGRVRILLPLYGEDKWAKMNRAIAVIYPSFNEPFGRVPFEAVAAGAYPIVPNESGSAEYLTPFLPECIYRHESASSLLEVMQIVERKHSSENRTGLKNAQAWVRKELDWERVTGEVLAIYEQILRPRARAQKFDAPTVALR